MHIRMVSFFAAGVALALLTVFVDTKPVSDGHDAFEIEEDDNVAKSLMHLNAFAGDRLKREAMYDGTGRVKREDTETEGTAKPTLSERWRSFREKMMKMLKKILKSGDEGTQSSIDAPKDMEGDVTSDCGTGIMARIIRWFWRAIGDQETRNQRRRGQGDRKGRPDQDSTGKEDAGKKTKKDGEGVDEGSGGRPGLDSTGKGEHGKKTAEEGGRVDEESGKEGAVDTAPGKKDGGDTTGGEGDAGRGAGDGVKPGEEKEEENDVGMNGAGEAGSGNETGTGNDASGKEKVEPPTYEVSDDWES